VVSAQISERQKAALNLPTRAKSDDAVAAMVAGECAYKKGRRRCYDY
jgi:hypothetical protein